MGQSTGNGKRRCGTVIDCGFHQFTPACVCVRARRVTVHVRVFMFISLGIRLERECVSKLSMLKLKNHNTVK